MKKEITVRPTWCLIKTEIQYKTESGLYLPETAGKTERDMKSYKTYLVQAFTGTEGNVQESCLKQYEGCEVILDGNAPLRLIEESTSEDKDTKIEYCLTRESCVISIVRPEPPLLS